LQPEQLQTVKECVKTTMQQRRLEALKHRSARNSKVRVLHPAEDLVAADMDYELKHVN